MTLQRDKRLGKVAANVYDFRITGLITLKLLVFFAAAVFWEFVAWFMHKYVMHGPGWILHHDHHVTSGRHIQKNDLYAIFFAFCSFLLIFFGLKNRITLMPSAGFGVALYGAGYIAFHDIMFHKRFKAIRFKPRPDSYLAGITKAHRRHHGTVTKDHAESFSFLWAPKKYAS